MDKCLFLTLQPVTGCDGASEKVFAQKDAIEQLGMISHISYLKVEEKLNLYFDDKRAYRNVNLISTYSKVKKYIERENINILYIRYTAYADIRFEFFLRSVCRLGVKIYMEIPTYPYDGEMKLSSLRITYQILMERFFRNRLSRYIYRIVTFSLNDRIFGIPTIKISNAPARDLPIKKETRIGTTINMIAVANISFWHGYDRLLKGIYNYYHSTHKYEVNLYLVGIGSKQVYKELVDLSISLGIEKFVKFVGSKNSFQLDAYFDKMHLAIGCLGCHRKGLVEVKSLKNVEYAMRGIPFVYSEENSDFDRMPYVYKIPADETDVSVSALCEFVNNLRLSPDEIHESVSNLTWKNQMRKIFEVTD